MENDVMDAVQRVADGILALEAELWAAAVANPAPAFTIVAAFIGVVGVPPHEFGTKLHAKPNHFAGLIPILWVPTPVLKGKKGSYLGTN